MSVYVLFPFWETFRSTYSVRPQIFGFCPYEIPRQVEAIGLSPSEMGSDSNLFQINLTNCEFENVTYSTVIST